MRRHNHARAKTAHRIIWITLGVIALLVGYMAVEPLWLRTHFVKLRSSDVPKAFVGYRIAFISDLHYGRYVRNERLRRVVRMVNAARPDLVLMGGDYISYSSKFIQPCFELLRGVKATDGVFCVLGNHDHWVDPDLVRHAIADDGFHVIDNTSYWISRNAARILVGGIGDWWEDSQMTEAALGGATKNDFCLIVSHNPDYFAETKDERIDLGLAGHTHGGQVTLFGLYAPILPIKHKEFRFGLRSLGKEQVYVTSGVGTITPPLRFFCRPEVVVFELSN